MRLLGKLGGALLVSGAALAGNWAGDWLRTSTIGGTQHGAGLIHTTVSGQTVLGVSVTLTNFIPAVLLAMLAGKPRTLYAFLSGMLISTLVGDVYEAVVLRDRLQPPPHSLPDGHSEYLRLSGGG